MAEAPGSDGRAARPRHKVAVLPGDGIGREVVPAAVRVLQSLQIGLEFEYFDVGAERFLGSGQAMPESVYEQVIAADAILLGAIGDPRISDSGYSSQVLMRLRRGLDLYANVRPARLLDERLCPLRDPDRRAVDLVVLRENTEGLYSGHGSRTGAGTAQDLAIQEHRNTHLGVTRIIEYAFTIARREVCMADKWNAMPHAGAIWQERFAAAAAIHPDIHARHLMIDAAALHLIQDPRHFDVIVTENAFGDILSDLCAGLVGGLGLAPSANLNPATSKGLFEPVHGSAPDIAGRGRANPIAAILTAAMALDHLGHPGEASAVRVAAEASVKNRECTPDIGGSLSTDEVAEAVIRRVGSL
ncbi:MAG TPA: isocitrate/isopropylmalate dehydrogenase family protein [Candidatus Nitrosotalea sp.]|nr:isocitrate/isopropylmalate dehydrogenase family protein [Candidatus Nitrosotalea sp.]